MAAPDIQMILNQIARQALIFASHDVSIFRQFTASAVSSRHPEEQKSPPAR
jgi:hypothetical protein